MVIPLLLIITQAGYVEEVDLGDCWRDRITRAMKPLLFGKIHSHSKSSAVDYIHHGVDGLQPHPKLYVFFYIKGFTVFATILRFVVLLKSDTDFSCIYENTSHDQYTFVLWSDDSSCSLSPMASCNVTHDSL